MSEHLRSMLPAGRRLVTPELAKGVRPSYDESECGALLAPLARPVHLGDLDTVVARALERTCPHDPSMDPDLSSSIHRALPLTRREASDIGVFRFLAVIRYPQLVRHRWEYRSFATMQSRFWAAGTRHDANSFSRWWWIAELTRDADDYSLTRAVLSRSALATFVFSRGLALHRPAVSAVAAVLAEAPSPLVEPTLRNLGSLLSVRVLEAMSEAELAPLVHQARQLAEAAQKAGPPRGTP